MNGTSRSLLHRVIDEWITDVLLDDDAARIGLERTKCQLALRVEIPGGARWLPPLACESCRYLGQHGTYDLYYCIDKDYPMLIARYGAESTQVSQVSLLRYRGDELVEPFATAYKLARAAKLTGEL